MRGLQFGEHHWTWRSIRPEANRYRYYRFSIQRDLWGRWGVVRRWGRIWGGSKEQHLWPESEADVRRLLRKTHQSRLRHGYSLVEGSASAGEGT